jgi:Mg2+ and Co2+ transporter CorA
LKHRIAELEEKVSNLHSRLTSKSKYDQIKALMNDDPYYEDEKYLYTIQDGIVWPIRKNGSLDESKRILHDYIKKCWKDPELLHSIMLGQKKLQTKLLNALTNDSIEKVITF